MNYVKKLDVNTFINQDDVIEAIYKIRNILFPNYFSSEVNTIQEIKKLLIPQVENAFKIKKQEFDISIIDTFFKEVNKIISILKTDLEAFLDGDPAAEDEQEIIMTYPGYFAITFYRISHILYKLKVPYIPRIISEHAHQKTGIDIHPGASISDYFFIDHGTGIVIGQTSIIGNHVRLYHGVTIGALSLKKGRLLRDQKRHPTIGNNVIIYSDASLLGKDTIIGDNVTIGSNAFITTSIAPNSIVRYPDCALEIIKKD